MLDRLPDLVLLFLASFFKALAFVSGFFCVFCLCKWAGMI